MALFNFTGSSKSEVYFKNCNFSFKKKNLYFDPPKI